eukprot:286773_1
MTSKSTKKNIKITNTDANITEQFETLVDAIYGDDGINEKLNNLSNVPKKETTGKAVAAFGSALAANKDKIKSGDPCSTIIGTLNVIGAISSCFGPIGLLSGGICTLVAGVMSFFQPSGNGPSMTDILSELLEKQTKEIGELIVDKIDDLKIWQQKIKQSNLIVIYKENVTQLDSATQHIIDNVKSETNHIVFFSGFGSLYTEKNNKWKKRGSGTLSFLTANSTHILIQIDDGNEFKCEVQINEKKDKLSFTLKGKSTKSNKKHVLTWLRVKFKSVDIANSFHLALKSQSEINLKSESPPKNKLKSELSSQQKLILFKKWLNSLPGSNLEVYLDIFIKNGFESIESLKYLDEETMEKMGINTLGHRKIIIGSINELNQNSHIDKKFEELKKQNDKNQKELINQNNNKQKELIKHLDRKEAITRLCGQIDRTQGVGIMANIWETLQNLLENQNISEINNKHNIYDFIYGKKQCLGYALYLINTYIILHYYRFHMLFRLMIIYQNDE